MEDAAGIYRTGPEMAEGADQLRRAAGTRRAGSASGTPAARFNTELVAALELANMLDVAECMLASGLRREESRGAHQRTDFPGTRRPTGSSTHHLVDARPRTGHPAVEPNCR